MVGGGGDMDRWQAVVVHSLKGLSHEHRIRINAEGKEKLLSLLFGGEKATSLLLLL